MQDVEKLKFVIVGDRGVGKRTLLSTGYGKAGRASSFYLPIEFNEITIKTNTKNYHVTVYDSIVNTTMVAKTDTHLINDFNATVVSGADAVLFCYAADSPSSLRNIPNWFKDIYAYFTPNTLLYVVETKSDLARRVSENDLKDLNSTIKFTEHFRISALNKNDVAHVFGAVVNKISNVRDVNRSQVFDKSTTKSTYLSPEKRLSSTQNEVRYSDSKEKIILMEGSYVKRMTVVDESKPGMQRSTRIESKNLTEKEPELEDF